MMADPYERTTPCRECGPDCLTRVWAANPYDQRGPDGHGYRGEYQHVPPEKLADGAGWGGDQCGDCGCFLFAVKAEGPRSFVVVCTGDDEIQGCGRTTPIVRVQSHSVVF